jgi:hypothetical protein
MNIPSCTHFHIGIFASDNSKTHAEDTHSQAPTPTPDLTSTTATPLRSLHAARPFDVVACIYHYHI